MAFNLQNLRESNEFLNQLLDNINSGVLIADENLKIYSFNNSFINMLHGDSPTVFGKTFGQAMGCIHTYNANKACGETPQCKVCPVRNALFKTARKGIPSDRVRFKEIFHVHGRPQQKVLEVTTRNIEYQGRKMVLMIFYDITELENQRHELEEKQRLINKDLEAAAGIQRSLLPNRLPTVPGFEFAWHFEPCKKVGGDFFNIIRLSPSHLAVYMIDICGHGVSAAFVSVAVSQFLQNWHTFNSDCSGVIPPANVLNRLNRAFPFERFDTFFTIVYTIIDLDNGTLSYSCAGHPPPLRLHSDGRQEELLERGPVIGTGTVEAYTQQTVKLKPGEKLLLYTDGILDNINENGAIFGRERFLECLKRHQQLSIQQIVSQVFRQVKEYSPSGKLEDDVSIIGIEFTGAKSTPVDDECEPPLEHA